jgi:hypothetical protein
LFDCFYFTEWRFSKCTDSVEEENDIDPKENKRTPDDRSHGVQSPSSGFEAGTHRNYDFS